MKGRPRGTVAVMQCPVCQTTDSVSKFFATHVLNEGEIEVTEYQCPNCYKTFRKKSSKANR